MRDNLGEDEWFVFISNFFEVHYCHLVLVCCYAASCSVRPLVPKQRNLQRSIVKFPYLLDDTKVAILVPIIAYCINTHTAILVRALFVLGSCVKCISIYLVPLVLHDCGRWCHTRFNKETECISYVHQDQVYTHMIDLESEHHYNDIM